MGLTLYEIDQMYADAWASVEAIAEANGGVIPDDWDRFLDDIAEEKRDKSVKIARWVKNLRAEAEAIREEEKRLADRRRALESKSDRLENYLASRLDHGEKISDPTVVIGWRKSQSLEVQDINALPSEFVRVEKSADKVAIKAAIKSGEKVEGCALIDRINISIK